MPLYDFRCTECGHRFDVLASYENAKKTVCPKCGAKVERVYQGTCAFGKGASSGGGQGCSGSCACCGGCHRE